MEDVVLGSVIAVIAIAFVIVGTLVSSAGDKKRTQGFERESAQAGYTFDPAAVLVYGRFDDVPLMNRGHSKKAQRLITCGGGEGDVWIFDYRYKTGYGRNTHTYSNTIAAFQGLEKRLPEFQLRPERLLDKLGSKVGFQDIDFDEHPEFSGKYLLRGPEVLAISELFKPECIDTIMRFSPLCIESTGSTLLVYRTKYVKPEELASFIEEAKAIKEVFTGERMNGRRMRSRLT